ncbi:MAG: hypothetical protein KC501_19615 [Myxococcales bacterium]|nr:hypothetical protein [Myxococcales bacterium]
MSGADLVARADRGGTLSWISTAAPAVVPLLLGIHRVDASSPPTTGWLLRGTAAGVALGLMAGVALRHRRPRLGRAVFVGSATGFGAMGVLGLADAPVASFVVALVAMALLAVTPSFDAVTPAAARRPRTLARAAAWAAAIVSLLLAAFLPSVDPFARAAGLLPSLIALVRARILLRTRARARVLVGAGVVLAGASASWSMPSLALLFVAAIPVGILLLLPDSTRTGATLLDAWSDALLGHPARLLLATFAMVGVAGGIALTIPAVSTGEPLHIIDGLFTAVSAVCVTGLIVVDTPTALTGLGQAIVLLLIQIGGLGILTFTTAAFLAIGNLGVRSEGIAARLLASETPRASLGTALRRVLLVTAVTEATGTVVLSIAFAASGEPLGGAVWRGLFTAISAYCNAGFALQSDSLVPHAGSPTVLLTVSALVIVGGLGPAVVVAVPAWLRRRPASLLVRVVLTTTAWLLAVPTLLFLVIEWDHALAELSVVDRVINAWFLSVTTRTAGFNSVEMGMLTAPTVTLVMMLMLVGGSPGSTAGGLKTTTAAVLFLASLATARGAATVRVWHRRIPSTTIRRALAATGAMVFVATGTLVFLQLTQPIPPVEAAFEVVSAIATVGLSLGVTAELDGIGRIAITILMLVGRVGPLVFLGVLMPLAPPSLAKCPQQDLPVG